MHDLHRICKTMAFMRADIWRRYGALKNVGKSAADIRKEITAGRWYESLSVDGTIRAETTKDVVNYILTYKAAAVQKVRQNVAKRSSNQSERRELYGLLRTDQWIENAYLHRRMRKDFRHGISKCNNQFIVRADRHEESIENGQLELPKHMDHRFDSSQIAMEKMFA